MSPPLAAAGSAVVGTIVGAGGPGAGAGSNAVGGATLTAGGAGKSAQGDLPRASPRVELLLGSIDAALSADGLVATRGSVGNSS